MLTATGHIDSVLVLGGDSDIGVATAAELIRVRGAGRVVLAGRRPDRLEERAATLAALGATVSTIRWDATEVDRHEEALGGVFDEGDVDVVVLAAGVLGDQATIEEDPAAVRRLVDTNFAGPAAALVVVAERLRRQGHGLLVVLSSIAATQARRANFGYGSSKAGLDAFALGLGDALDGAGPNVLVVRPGFVRSSMTAGMPEAPLSCDPQDVARAITAAADATPPAVLYVPPAVRWVSWLLRALPRGLVRRLPR